MWVISPGSPWCGPSNREDPVLLQGMSPDRPRTMCRLRCRKHSRSIPDSFQKLGWMVRTRWNPMLSYTYICPYTYAYTGIYMNIHIYIHITVFFNVSIYIYILSMYIVLLQSHVCRQLLPKRSNWEGTMQNSEDQRSAAHPATLGPWQHELWIPGWLWYVPIDNNI